MPAFVQLVQANNLPVAVNPFLITIILPVGLTATTEIYVSGRSDAIAVKGTFDEVVMKLSGAG